MKIPKHIKTHVDRIIREYELLYSQGHIIALQILVNHRLYAGIETTEFFLNSAKLFREILDNPNHAFFSDTEKEIRKKIYEKILEFYKPLPQQSLLRITRTTECQEQLKRILRSAKQNMSVSEDAHQISWFISNASTLDWCQADETVNHKIFKLVQTEDAFQKLLKNTTSTPIVEITEASQSHYSSFRIAFQFFDIPDGYRKQVRMRELQNFWQNSDNIDNFDTDYKIFNMWNGITETGIYYVYIPQKTT